MRKRESLPVPLNEKRLLSLTEFQTYCGLGRNAALNLSIKAKCRFNIDSRRILIDRVQFDKWCEQNCY